MNHKHVITLIAVTLTVLGTAQSALADAAPPPPPPGSSVTSDDPSTYVQMVSESVLMVIADNNSLPAYKREGLEERFYVADKMIGHTQGYFAMVNQGTTTETLDVRFPLGSGYGQHEIEDFTAYVDGEIAPTTQVDQESMLWAVWQVTFPPGQTVNLGVDYEMYPYGGRSWGTFSYTLETGAGWYGLIGKGTITLRLPYDVSDQNTALKEYPEWGLDWRPQPDFYTVSGADVVWHFNNLEPTEEDNISITVLAPSIWREIQEAREAAEVNPESVEALLRSAHALGNGVDSLPVGADPPCYSYHFLEEADTTYRRVLKLAPDNLDVYLDYLDFRIRAARHKDRAYHEQTCDVLGQALQVAPDDPRLNDDPRLREMEALCWPTPTSTLAQTPRPIRPTSTPGPTLIALMPSQTPTLTLTSTPTFIPTLTGISTAIPPSSNTPPIGEWVAIGAVVVIGGAGLGVWTYYRRRAA